MPVGRRLLTRTLDICGALGCPATTSHEQRISVTGVGSGKATRNEVADAGEWQIVPAKTQGEYSQSSPRHSHNNGTNRNGSQSGASDVESLRNGNGHVPSARHPSSATNKAEGRAGRSPPHRQGSLERPDVGIEHQRSGARFPRADGNPGVARRAVWRTLSGRCHA